MARPPKRCPQSQATGQGQDGEDAREGTDGVVGLAEEADPEVQQVVIERRGPVVLERLGDVVQGQPGDVDGECLVEPEARAGPEAEQEPDGHDQRHDDAGDEVRVRPVSAGTSSGMGRMVGQGVRGLGSSAAGGGVRN